MGSPIHATDHEAIYITIWCECMTLTSLGIHLISQGRVRKWWECILWRSAPPYDTLQYVGLYPCEVRYASWDIRGHEFTYKIICCNCSFLY